MNTLILRSVSAASLLLSMSAAASAQTNSSNALNDEIIVTGSPLTTTVDEAITGVSVLTGEELSRRLAGTIGETLKSEPGVSSTFFGAGASRPIIRGQGGDRVRVLLNGLVLLTPHPHLQTTPLQQNRPKLNVSKFCAEPRFYVTAHLAQAALSMLLMGVSQQSFLKTE